jgi:hypothetical protein
MSANGLPLGDKFVVSQPPSYQRDLWDAAHKLAMVAEISPPRISWLTQQLYDLTLAAVSDASGSPE